MVLPGPFVGINPAYGTGLTNRGQVWTPVPASNRPTEASCLAVVTSSTRRQNLAGRECWRPA